MVSRWCDIMVTVIPNLGKDDSVCRLHIPPLFSFSPPPTTIDSEQALNSHVICDRNNLSGTNGRPCPVAF